jgi:hypothetical protein
LLPLENIKEHDENKLHDKGNNPYNPSEEKSVSQLSSKKT